VPCHSLSYIHSLCIIITLGWNITGPARRREEGTYGDGGKDDGRAGGSLGRSTEDGIDASVHTEPWRRIGSCSITSIVPSSRPYSVPYSYESQNFSHVWYIYLSGLTHAISSPCRTNRRHQTTLMLRPALRQTNPTTHLADDLLLVVIVWLVWDTWSKLMFVKNLCLWVGNTYIDETWSELRHVYEKLVRFIVFMRYVVSMMYVRIMWYMFCLFGWKNKKK
jgi:hypothetical protein